MIRHLKMLSGGTAIGAALLLAACHPSADGSADGNALALPALPATLPLEAGAASAPHYAPSADALPAALRLPTVRVADQRDAYAYADDAWDFGDAVYDAPPDYGFDYGGTEPWAWQGYDQSLTFVEPVDDGYRYYYYRPGAASPYFVRDADYGYGYDDGQLAVIYGPGGAILPYDRYGPRIDYAARYFARGRDLYAASRERERRSVVAANWAARSAAISAAQARWAAERAQQSEWRDYHQRVAPVADRHWQEERVRRQADEQRFATWQRADYRTAPPPRVIPAAWQRARWASDEKRYVAMPANPQRDARIASQGRPQDLQPRQPGDRAGDANPQRPALAVPVSAGMPGAQRPPHAALPAPPREQPAQTRGARITGAARQQAAEQPRRDASRLPAPAQQRGAQPIGQQARQAERGQADPARAQAQVAARAQARAAQSAARDQARGREQAAGQARQQAQQQARAQAQAPRIQAPPPRPAPPPQRPQAAPAPHGGGGQDRGDHGHRPG